MTKRALSWSLLLLLLVGLTAIAQEPPHPPEHPEPPHPPEGMPHNPPEKMDRPPHEEPGRLPEHLEEMIEVALLNNPDIRLARIELERAEAELMRTSQEVVREVVDAFHERERHGTAAEGLHEELGRMEALAEQGRAPEHELAELHQEMRGFHTEMAQIEAHLRYLLGLLPGGPEPRPPHHEEPVPPERRERAMWERPPLPERYRDILERSADFELDGTPLAEFLEIVREVSGGLNFVFEEGIGDVPVSIHLRETPLRQALVAVSELLGGELCFVVRDYGILVTETGRARTMPGPTIPEYIPYHGLPIPPEPQAHLWRPRPALRTPVR